MNDCIDKDVCGLDFEQIESDISKKKLLQKGLLILDLCEEERLAAAAMVALTNTYISNSCKSKKCNETKELLNGAFRVMMITPEGPFIHQFDAEYWDFFKCQEVDYIKLGDYSTDVLDYNHLLYMDRDALFKSVMVRDSGLAIIKTD